MKITISKDRVYSIVSKLNFNEQKIQMLPEKNIILKVESNAQTH